MSYAIWKTITGWLKYAKSLVLLPHQKAMWEVQAKVNSLEVENRELKNKLSLRDKHYFDPKWGAYFEGTPDNHKPTPKCSGCYDAKELFVHMHAWPHGEGFRCPVCTTDIRTPNVSTESIEINPDDFITPD